MMTPVTLVIDRTFRGVGRVKKATGTMNPAVRRKMSRMLTQLHDDARLELLRDIRDNRLTLMEVYDAYQRGALDALPTGSTAKPLVAAMRAWIDSLEPGVDYSAKHIVSFGTSLKYLEQADVDARIAELPALLEQLRDSLGRAHPRSFNLLRAAVSAFLRVKFKKAHPLYLAVQAVEARKVAKRAPRPDLTPEWMRNMFPAPETDAVDAIAWAMATTGMGPKEYWGEWYVSADRIRIMGTKREARVREVPLVLRPSVPRLSPGRFDKKLRARTNKQIQPYDLRRTFARWMERAGVVRIRRMMYMGHAAGDVTALYEESELSGYLAADARTIRVWLGLESPDATPQPQGLRKVE